MVKKKPFWIWTIKIGVEIKAGGPSTNVLSPKLSVNSSVIWRARSPSSCVIANQIIVLK